MTDVPPQTVGEFLRATRASLSKGTVAIAGEVSASHFHAASGHLYFDLKDHEGVLKCAFYRYKGDPVVEGARLRVEGRADLFVKKGAFQLIAQAIHPLGGAGDAATARAALIARLQAEGLLDRPRRPPPSLPRHVVLVTSKQSAACADMLAGVRHRFARLRVTVVDATVQGADAPASIVRAMAAARALEPTPSVLVIARGGGSAEDLVAFDDEAVVRAACASPIPVVSAIGHETDHPVLDLVADVRAKTPTAAVEMVVPLRAELVAAMEERIQSLRVAAIARVPAWRDALRRVDVARASRGRFETAKTEVQLLARAMRSAVAGRVSEARARQVGAARTLAAVKTAGGALDARRTAVARAHAELSRGRTLDGRRRACAAAAHEVRSGAARRVAAQRAALDRLRVAQRIDRAIHMGNIAIVEAAQHMADCINFPDIAEELVP